MLHEIPEFDVYYVAYLKDDSAKEPVAVSYSAPGGKTGWNTNCFVMEVERSF
jgi:hypothetical protein